jgi:hypothetical protein
MSNKAQKTILNVDPFNAVIMKIDLHCHNKEQVDRAYTIFENSVHTMDELVEEIKKGNLRGMMQNDYSWY